MAVDGDTIDRDVCKDVILHALARKPEGYGFIPDAKTAQQIEDNVHNKNFTALLYTCGVEFVLTILERFAELEHYEICGRIKGAIEMHNALSIDNLPTKLEDLE